MNYQSVLVTGGSGFIGNHLLKKMPGATNIDMKEGQNICDELPDINFQYVFHLAASKSVAQSEADPQRFILNNCWGTTNVLRKYKNARVINVSSSSANQVRSVYGATKAFGEMIGDMHGNCINARLYNVFGEGQLPESGAVVPTFISHVLDGKSPPIYGSGIQERDFTYVGDVVDYLHYLMFSTFKIGLVHVGYSDSISVLQLLQVICNLVGKTVMPEFLPRRAFEIENSKAPYEVMSGIGRLSGLKLTVKWFQDGCPKT